MIFGESFKDPPLEGPVVGTLTRPPRGQRGRRGGRGRAQHLHDAGNARGLCPGFRHPCLPCPAQPPFLCLSFAFAFALASSFALAFGDPTNVTIKENAQRAILAVSQHGSGDLCQDIGYEGSCIFAAETQYNLIRAA